MGDWTEESLNNTVEHFFSGSPLTVEIKEEIRSVYVLLTVEVGKGERGLGERGEGGGRERERGGKRREVERVYC